MTNYRESSAYDLSLFEPQVVEPRKPRQAEPVRKQSTKKTVNKNVKRNNENAYKRPAAPKTAQKSRAVNNSKKATVTPTLIKAGIIVFCLLSAVFARLFMYVESDMLDLDIAATKNEIANAECETVRLKAEFNGMIDSQKAIEYAEEKLGMVKAESYQITYIDLSQGDEFVVAGEKEVDGKGEFTSEIKSLFAYIF